jgi:hypothetical protein
MRFLVLLLALALGTAAHAADGLTVVRVYTGWREAASFKRISEYFDGKENTGGEVVLRTHADQRGGYYFLIRLANPGAPLAARIQLLVVTPDSANPREFTFPIHIPTGGNVYNLGLTGADWPEPKVNAVAWRVQVLDESGKAVATEKSYLWEKPAGN